MSGWVTVTGPPFSICLRKMGTTLPEEPRTLPKRTATKRGARGEGRGARGAGARDEGQGTREEMLSFACPLPLAPCPSFSDWMYSSAMRLVAPMTLVGLTALSVETMTKAVAPDAAAASATVLVPKTLFLMASPGLS